MTNREWLNTLTDKELLENVHIRCVAVMEDDCPDGLTCKQCQRKWLAEEHKETKND